MLSNNETCQKASFKCDSFTRILKAALLLTYAGKLALHPDEFQGHRRPREHLRNTTNIKTMQLASYETFEPKSYSGIRGQFG